ASLDSQRDPDETCPKRLVNDRLCAIREQQKLYENENEDVSNSPSVRVKAPDVDEMYEDLLSPKSSYFQGAQFPKVDENPLDVDNLLALVRQLPKEMFISQIIKVASSDRDLLEAARYDIFECIKAVDGYPYDSRANLKRRIQTRSGSSIEYKLAQDLHCLSSVLEGADWSDLSEVINIPRTSKKSQSQADMDYSFQAYNVTDVEILKRTIQEITADIVAMKQDCKSLKSEIQSEVKSIRKDLREIQSSYDSELSELRMLISTNALSIERLSSEKSNGVASLKSDIKLIKSDIKNIQDEPVFSVNTAALGESMVKVGTFEKRLGRVEKRLQGGEQAQTQNRLEEPNTERNMYSTVHLNKSNHTALVRSDELKLFSRIPIDSCSARDEQISKPLPLSNNVDRSSLDCNTNEHSLHSSNINKSCARASQSDGRPRSESNSSRSLCADNTQNAPQDQILYSAVVSEGLKRTQEPSGHINKMSSVAHLGANSVNVQHRSAPDIRATSPVHTNSDKKNTHLNESLDKTAGSRDMIGYKRIVERQDPDRTFMYPIPIRINGSVTCEANITQRKAR
ncbi:MAG: hypothetical protein AB2541_06300, partial [Candidatus Thiodiazotropha sp.]